MELVNNCFLWVRENGLFPIAIVLLLGLIYSLKGNDLLFHKNTIKDYIIVIKGVKTTYIKYIVLNLVIIVFLFLFYKNPVKYETILTVVSILTTSVLGMISIINGREVIEYYKSFDSEKSIKPKRISETNSIANLTILLSGIIIFSSLLVQISSLGNCELLNKLVVFTTIFYLENFLMLVRRFSTIYINYLKSVNY